ncbi:hypothetical protein ACWGDX_04860 [Streptomyces sp. NPDC055025]
MSELFVSRTHIDALLTAALRWSESYESWQRLTVSGETSALGAPDSRARVVVNAESADELGRIIWVYHIEYCEWDEDILAEARAYVFDALPGEPDPVVILHAIAFYMYQTQAETLEDWSDTLPCQFMLGLKDMAISRLPDINRVPWGLDDRDIFLKWAARTPR